mmetsp:Transcript_75394/g.157136  ORF Transcript_75394/g.157136 Transcript_75394/m.157136 type:complete len:324 (+) Transcript_75394:5324-6295(+)
MNLFVALLLDTEGSSRQLALLVGHEVTSSGEGQALQVQHVRRLLLLILSDPSLASESPFIVEVRVPLTSAQLLKLLDLLSQVPRHVALAISLLRGTVQFFEDRLGLGCLLHVLEHGILLLLGLCLTQSGTVQDLEPVSKEELRELEIFVLQHLHQPVLTLLQVLDGQDGQNFLLGGDTLVGIGEDLAELTLKPMRIDLLNLDVVLPLLPVFLLLFVVDGCDVDTAVVAIIVHLAFIVVIVVIIFTDLSEEIALSIVLIIFVEDDSDTGGVIQTFFGSDSVILFFILDIRTIIRNLLGQSEELREELVGDGSQDLLDVPLSLAI